MTNPYGIDEDIVADLNTMLSGGRDLNEVEIMKNLDDSILKMIAALSILPSVTLQHTFLKKIIFRLLGNAFAAGVTVGKMQGQRDLAKKLN